MSGKGNQEVAAQAAVGEGERTITLIKRLARPPGFNRLIVQALARFSIKG
jgi:hypothetical protein